MFPVSNNVYQPFYDAMNGAVSFRRLTRAEYDDWLAGKSMSNVHTIDGSPQPSISDPAERQLIMGDYKNSLINRYCRYEPEPTPDAIIEVGTTDVIH